VIRKLMICPWFGDEPEWASRYHRNADTLAEHGFDFLHDRDLESFRERVADVLGVACPIVPGSDKIHDFRPAFGELYRDELAGYDFWGHTDYDCVYGRVGVFATDELLGSADVQTDNGFDYLCGPWTLYRNTPEVASLFRRRDGWRGILESPTNHGWVETSFTEVVYRSSLRVQRDAFHAHLQPELLWTDGERLMHDDREISFFHFRHTKSWPQIRMVEHA
jgi:hypothetical protein